MGLIRGRVIIVKEGFLEEGKMQSFEEGWEKGSNKAKGMRREMVAL